MLIEQLLLGLQTALTLNNLGYALLGAVFGTLVGVLPGLGPVATAAMLLPSTYALDATSALIMMAGIYYGAQYGGSTTAILINVPGEPSSTLTALDGHQMARNGRAGAALATAALASFFAGCVGTLVIAVLGPPLTRLALEFGPAEYFSLMLLGLVGATALSSGSVLRGLGMTCVGLLLGQVGTDIISGVPRFSLGIAELTDGIGFVVIAMGVFGLGQMVETLAAPAGSRDVLRRPVGRLWLNRDEWRQAWPAALRGTGIGAVLGVLPGAGAMLSAFAAYSVERRLARDPALFGQGAIQGVAAPEAANNAGAQTSFIPMLTLGIPPHALMALMIGVMMIKGITPGPQVMTRNPELFWGLIASMWVGNAMLVILNLPLIGIWVRLLAIPYRFLFPAILAFCCIGLYTLGNNTFDIRAGAFFTAVGYLLCKLRCEPAPMLLGLVLGQMMEENLRRALLIGDANWRIFVERPISAILLLAAALVLASAALPALRRRVDAAARESAA